MPLDGISRDPVIETLVGAKAIILQYGRLRGALGEAGGPRCVVGAIQQAAIEQGLSPLDACSAVAAYSDVVRGTRSAETNVMDWQDAPERAVEEVLAGFDKAVEVRLRTLAALVSAN